MAHQFLEDEKERSKRRRLTGSSKWTINAISRQIAERQAMVDVDDMLSLQQEASSGCHCPKSIDQIDPDSPQVFSELYSSRVKENMEVSSFCNDEDELKAINDREEDTPSDLIGFNPMVESILTDSEFPEAVFDNYEKELSELELSEEEVDKDDLSVASENDFDRIQTTRLLSAAFYLKHGLSKSGLGDFLDILNISSTRAYQDDELRSPYMFMKRYGLLKGDLKRVYPCTTCSKTLVNDEGGYPIQFQPCGHIYCQETSDKCYTLLLPVEDQVKFFLRHHGIKKTDEPALDTEDRKGDVFTGDRYKQYVKDGLISEHTVTMQINTDGAQKFKSSKYSFWPFMGIINETGYKTRRSNVILMAIWFGNKKPPRNAFVDPCVVELEKLCTTGIECDGKIYTVRPVIVTVDTVARPILRNTMQFNGAYGCDFCLHPGKSVKIGKGSALVYCNRTDGTEPKYPLRSTFQYRNDLKEAIKSGKPFNGIKGPSTLADIEDFDFIGAFIPEYMHCICLGVIRYLILLWISPTYSKEPWYISKHKLEILNRRLSNTKPPYDITRTPRSLQNIKFWKASEFRAFALYYFALLEGILPEPYFSHFANFSYALSILLQESVPTQCVKDVGVLLDDFVQKVEFFYGEKYVKFNVHLLTHLSKSVLDWGCLWATSAFIPEWFNGQLQNLSNGTQAVVEQMASSFLMKNSVRNEAIALLKNQSVPYHISKLIRRMICLPNMYEFQTDKGLNIEGDISLSLLGNHVMRMFTLDEQTAAENALLLQPTKDISENERKRMIEMIENNCCAFYPRVFFRNGSKSIFTTSAYVRSKKRINYCALLNDGRFFLIENFAFIEKAKKTFHVFIFGRSMGKEFKKTYSPCLVGNEFVRFPGQTTKLTGLGDFEAILPYQIVRKCVVSAHNSLLPSFIVTALANTMETD